MSKQHSVASYLFQITSQACDLNSNPLLEKKTKLPVPVDLKKDSLPFSTLLLKM